MWKMNNYIDCIKSKRTGFDKTMDAAKLLYPGNTLLAKFEDRYIQSLRFQSEDNERTTSVHTGNHTRTNQSQEPSLEAVDHFNSPMYMMGQETQLEEVIKTAERDEQEMMGSASELCEQEMMCSADMEDNRETDCMKSPFYVRVVNADKDKNSDEKRLYVYIFSKMAGNVSDVLFKTKYGQKSSRGQIESLGPQEPVDNNVLSSWSGSLNFLEGKKDKNSLARLFLPVFEVDIGVLCIKDK
ncbi:hypothetical protein Tco_1222320, partial [Tanacetum coccineum]